MMTKLDVRGFAFLLAAVLLILILLGAGKGQRVSRRCSSYIRERHTAQNEFAETQTSFITPRCSTNRITWYKPRYDHVITFYKSHKSFSVCLNAHSPGINIFRLKGTSRRLISGSNSSGDLGCHDTECKHLTLLFGVESYVTAKSIRYTYKFKLNDKCPKCTEVCQRMCMCTAQYVFVGKLQRSVSDGEGMYTLYFKIAEYIKYNSLYNKHSRMLKITEEIRSLPQCEANENSTIGTVSILPTHAPAAAKPHDTNLISNGIQNDIDAPQSNSLTNSASLNIQNGGYSQNDAPELVPQHGKIKAYSKCLLSADKTYIVSGYFVQVIIAGRRRDRLVVCCAEQDARHAANHLREMLLRQQCCRQ